MAITVDMPIKNRKEEKVRFLLKTEIVAIIESMSN